MRSRLSAYWDYVPSKYKRWIVVGLVGVAIVGAIYMFVSSSPKTKTKHRQPQQRNIFGTRDFESRFGLSGVGSELEQMQRKNKKLEDQINRLTDKNRALPQITMLKNRIKDFESRFGLSGGRSELEQMQQGNKKTSELDRLQQENRKLQKQLELMLKSRSSAGNAPESK